MALLEDKWANVNYILMRDAPAMKNLGLLNGKMGVSLYFFHLSRDTGKADHLKFAEKLLDEVYEVVVKNPVTCDFGDGLAGISWALAHLIKEQFVEADVDEVLSEADDKIFQSISNNPEMNLGFTDGLMGYFTYLVSRLESTGDAHQERAFVLKRLLVDLVNRMCQAIEEKKWRLAEPPLLSFNWDLPLFLTLLGKAKDLQLHGNKIDRLIEAIAPSVLSYFPYRHVNRLYLLYGLRHILNNFNLPQWERHAVIIHDQFDQDIMLNKELMDKNIYFSSGLAGVSFILNSPNRAFSGQDNLLLGADMVDRIIKSDFFNSIINENSEVKPSLGFMQGLAGIGMQFLFSCRANRSLRNLGLLLKN
ncbi:MAG TPA: lanthionine synthetase LanC family protein [Cyclobacteriaceae bacterium]|nr:lanthionine synthetase LanC family protein [Cyclobacteriaceae bacterium]